MRVRSLNITTESLDLRSSTIGFFSLESSSFVAYG
jgi:hypothetical protein